MPWARGEWGRREDGAREGKKERGPIHDCVGKWVKRQVERAANLNHRQFCAVQFDSARSFRNLPPPSLPFSLSSVSVVAVTSRRHPRLYRNGLNRLRSYSMLFDSRCSHSMHPRGDNNGVGEERDGKVSCREQSISIGCSRRIPGRNYERKRS